MTDSTITYIVDNIKEKAVLLMYHIYKSQKYLKPENGEKLKTTIQIVGVEFASNYMVPMSLTVCWFKDYDSMEEYRKTHSFSPAPCYSKGTKSIMLEIDYINDWFDVNDVWFRIEEAFGEAYLDYMKTRLDKTEFKEYESVFLNEMFPHNKLGVSSDTYEYGNAKPLTENRIRLY